MSDLNEIFERVKRAEERATAELNWELEFRSAFRDRYCVRCFHVSCACDRKPRTDQPYDCGSGV